MAYVFSQSEIQRFVKPRLRQIHCDSFIADEGARKALQKNLRCKIIARSGASFDAEITLRGDELYATLKGMPYGFQYKQVLLIVFIGKPSIVLQVKIKESYNNTLVLGSSPIRFHERLSIEAPCLIYDLPKFYTDKFISGDYLIRRKTFQRQENANALLWNDELIHKETQKIIKIEDFRHPSWGTISSISRGGVGISRHKGELLPVEFNSRASESQNSKEFEHIIKVETPNPLKYRYPQSSEQESATKNGLIYIQTTLQWGSNFFDLRCIAGVRQTLSGKSSDTMSCAFLGDLPSLPKAILSTSESFPK